MRKLSVWVICGVGLAAVTLVVATDRGERVIETFPLVERLSTRWVPPAPPEIDEAFTPAEREALARLGKVIDGRLVWSSNREGNHELYLAHLGTAEVRRLTNDPHVDYYSRFSPDGTRISFLRSQRPWVSFREEDAWDLYLMNADGSDARRLVEHAYEPTWLPDGSGLVFVRDNVVMTLDLATDRTEVLQDGSSAPTTGRVGGPEVSADGRLALTVQRRDQRVGVLNHERSRYAPLSDPRACEISWFPGGDRLLWVSGTGHGGTRIMHGRPEGSGGEVLMDLPGAYSHEYFPRVSPDGRWLVWGAAAEGHEHDRADYEIFVWRIATPWESARRITHNPANDQWPDLFIDVR